MCQLAPLPLGEGSEGGKGGLALGEGGRGPYHLRPGSEVSLRETLRLYPLTSLGLFLYRPLTNQLPGAKLQASNWRPAKVTRIWSALYRLISCIQSGEIGLL